MLVYWNVFTNGQVVFWTLAFEKNLRRPEMLISSLDLIGNMLKHTPAACFTPSSYIFLRNCLGAHVGAIPCTVALTAARS
jgi:hypothetical protein